MAKSVVFPPERVVAILTPEGQWAIVTERPRDEGGLLLAVINQDESTGCAPPNPDEIAVGLAAAWNTVHELHAKGK